MWTVAIYGRDFTYNRGEREWIEEEQLYESYDFKDYESALKFANQFSRSDIADTVWFDEEIDIPALDHDIFEYDVFDDICSGTHKRITIVEALN